MAEPALKIDPSMDEGQSVSFKSSNDNASSGGGRQVEVGSGQSVDLGEIKPGEDFTISIDKIKDTKAKNDNADQLITSSETTQGAPKIFDNALKKKALKFAPKKVSPPQEFSKKLEPWDKDKQETGIPETGTSVPGEGLEGYQPPQVSGDEQRGAEEEMSEDKQLTDKERKKRKKDLEQQTKKSTIDNSKFTDRLNPLWHMRKRKINILDNKLDKQKKVIRSINKEKIPLEAKKKFTEMQIAIQKIRLLFLAILLVIGLLIALISWGYLAQMASWSWKAMQKVGAKLVKLYRELSRINKQMRPIKNKLKKPLKKMKKINKKITKLYNQTGYGGKNTAGKRSALAKNIK